MNAGKTQAGFTVSTLHYMSPEQVHGHADTRTDIYAFGLLVYQLMTGQPPVKGETMQEIFYKILNEPLDLTAMTSMQMPVELVDLVRKCTQKDPALRPASFDEVCGVLSGLLARFAPLSTVMMPPPSNPSVAVPEPAAPGKAAVSSKAPLFAGAAVAALAVMGAAWWFLKPA